MEEKAKEKKPSQDDKIEAVATEQALQRREAGAIALPPQEGMGDVLLTDLVISRFHIVQPQSKEAIKGLEKAGTFHSNLGAVRSTLHVVPLMWRRGQVRYPTREEGDSVGVCRSNDGLKPDPRINTPFNGTCNEVLAGRLRPVCDQAKWARMNGKNSPPRCSQRYTFVMVDRDECSPFMISFSKTSAFVARVLITRAFELRGPLYSVEAKLSLNLQENDLGTYYVPIISDVGKLPDDELPRFAEAFRMFASVDIDGLAADADGDAKATVEKDAADPLPF